MQAVDPKIFDKKRSLFLGKVLQSRHETSREGCIIMKKIKYFSFLSLILLFLSSIVLGDTSTPAPPGTWPTCDLYYGTDISKYLNPKISFAKFPYNGVTIYHHNTTLLIKNADMGRISPDGKHIVYVGLGPYICIQEFNAGKVGKILAKYPWGMSPIWLDNDSIIFAEIEPELDKTDWPFAQQYYYSKGLRKYTISTNQFSVLTTESDIPNDVSYDGETVLFCRTSNLKAIAIPGFKSKVSRQGDSWIMRANKDFSMEPVKFVMGQDALFVIGESRQIIVAYVNDTILLEVDDNFKDTPGTLDQKMISSHTWATPTTSVTKSIFLTDRRESHGSTDYWRILKNNWLKWKDEGPLSDFTEQIAGGSEPNGSTKGLHLHRDGKDFVLSQYGDFEK
jgi:hypothetical protein